MHIAQRQVGNIVILELIGRLTTGEPHLMLREYIQRLVRERRVKVILKLAHLTYIDSTGLSELVWAFTTLRNKQGDLKLLQVTPKFKDYLQITKMLTVFETFDDEAKAALSFAPKENLVTMLPEPPPAA